MLRTPSLDLPILAGVTRSVVLELAPSVGYDLEQGAYPLAQLVDADEVFLTSSIREVMPVASVDDTNIGTGPAAQALQDALRALARLPSSS